ncbi:hypothetical protein P170DRAFT_505905 [Aspergillus steynii IBT 23096]|uniref:Uncharacterized protein n=1 Tax=Aspergillus steynii IBT 23096 TaxID=1392250 RepID=A0A2I2GR03_9EURO|nr:uncharacterized protein P170DRAFT_505905 [Aspergillus steynii IBT 23096]PLB55291.1 hypothetical protein P170DRAFT_505905 [Aspergillus steynii IBT 23096]
MDNLQNINSPEELGGLLKSCLESQQHDLQVKCPESFLYTQAIENLLKSRPKGNRVWWTYDAENGILKVSIVSRPLHDATTSLAFDFMAHAQDGQFIPSDLHQRLVLSRRGFIMTLPPAPETRSNKAHAWIKYPDVSIVLRASQRIPVVVFETGFTEDAIDLESDAIQWLLRSDGQVQLVIAIEIREDTRTRDILRKEPPATRRLLQLIRSFGTDALKESYGISTSDDDPSDSDPELYKSIRKMITVTDWVGPISVVMTLWELCGTTPVVREKLVVLPRPESPQNPSVKITDLFPTDFQPLIEDFNPNLVKEIDLEYYRELLSDATEDHAFERAVKFLRS